MESTAPEPVPAAATPASRWVLGTRLTLTSYDALIEACQRWALAPRTTTVDFTNTHIVTLRRHDAEFERTTRCFDYFIPDGMPLIWCLNAQGAGLKDRVYGPTFMRRALQASPASAKHYFLGGSEECLAKLYVAARQLNPSINMVGEHHGYFTAADEAAIVAEINELSPDFIWVGLGTPKQQDWINRQRNAIQRGVILAVGFAFDVNAGTKPDAPLWMQRVGLTWLYRMCSEPRRLLGRYLKYNGLFLWYLLVDGVRGRDR